MIITMNFMMMITMIFTMMMMMKSSTCSGTWTSTCLGTCLHCSFIVLIIIMIRMIFSTTPKAIFLFYLDAFLARDLRANLILLLSWNLLIPFTSSVIVIITIIIVVIIIIIIISSSSSYLATSRSLDGSRLQKKMKSKFLKKRKKERDGCFFAFSHVIGFK